VYIEPFPSYSPELNPNEFVWTYYKRDLSTERPHDIVNELLPQLIRLTKNVRVRRELLRSFVTASDLPILFNSWGVAYFVATSSS
jgi:transposase